MSLLKKIVIIEDDKILLKSLKAGLANKKFKIFPATDGESGLELIKREIPDLVLLDLLMPKMNGFDVLKILSQDKKLNHIPVIILSNLGENEDIQKGLELGAIDYYKKASTDLKQLTKKISNILTKKID